MTDRAGDNDRAADTPPPIATAAAARPDLLVGRNFLALGSGEVLSRLVAFGAMIYLARTLGARSYGVLGFARAFVLYFDRIADAGIDIGIGAREVAAGPEHLRRIGSSILSGRLILASMMVVILMLIGLVLPQPDGQLTALYGLTLLMVALSTRWVLLGLERTALIAVARTAGELLMVALVFIWVNSPGDLARVPLAQLIGDALAVIILAVSVRRLGYAFPVRFELNLLRPLIRRAIPFVGSAILGLMIFNSDLLFLRFMRGPVEVGYYVAAYALISFLLNVGFTYSLSLLPTLTRLAADKGGGLELYHTALAHVFAIGLPIAVGGWFVSSSLIAVMYGAEYAPSGLVLSLLLWSTPLSFLRDVPVMGLVTRGREDHILRATAAAAALNLLLNLALIPRFGMVGAACATVATEGARMCLSIGYARRLGFSVPGVSRFWRTLVASGVMAGVLAALGPTPAIWIGVPLGIASYAAALAAVGGIRFRSFGVPILSV